MKPTLVQYDAPGWGVGEVWLDEDGRVFHSELPRPRPLSRLRAGSEAAQTLALRLQAIFAGVAVSFHDEPLAIPDGFYGDCARALLTVPRGEVVTYGELAALAGYPGAARAAGTFCARCELAP
ncbi:MAG: MGMT family protein, partial [Gaiellaceae bacterium]